MSLEIYGLIKGADNGTNGLMEGDLEELIILWSL